MIRIGRLTDYGLIILAQMGQEEEELKLYQASELALQTGIAPPTVAKLLTLLAHKGFLNSVRGAKGGYRLAKPTERINVNDIITALEGPLAITTCNINEADCQLAARCDLKAPWRHINHTIIEALSGISLQDLVSKRGQIQ